MKMVDRKIHIGEPLSNFTLYIDGDDTFVDSSLTEYLSKKSLKKFKFSRRKFPKARSLTFNRDDSLGSIGFVALKSIWLCANKCEQLLGVNPNSRKFKLWYKSI